MGGVRACVLAVSAAVATRSSCDAAKWQVVRCATVASYGASSHNVTKHLIMFQYYD